MRVPRHPTRLLAALALLLAAGCATDAATNPVDMMPGHMGGSPNVDALTLAFASESIRVAPRSEASISVQVRPPGAYNVRFSLLDGPNGGLTLGAALNRSEVVSDANGRASVVLTAPNTPTRFQLRAQVDSYFATTTISVEAGALTTLNVMPNYTGSRNVRDWIASVHAGARCSDFTAPPEDSAFFVRAELGEPLELVDVPAAAPLAVVVRAGSLARGCATVEVPTPNGETDVAVAVGDTPLDLSRSVLDLVFGLDAQDAAFKTDLQAGGTLMQATLRGANDNDLSSVLDGMAAALSANSRAKFTRARSEAGWDQSAATALGRGASTRLGDALTRWLRIGQSALLSPQAFQARLEAGAVSTDVPQLSAQRLGGVLVEAIGVTATGSEWSVDPHDTLAFSGSLSWPPASLACALATPPAQAETAQVDLASALAHLLSCDDLGAHLASSTGDTALVWSAACDAACNAALCQQALATALPRACAASTKDLTTLTLLATGSAQAGDLAEATSFTGTWVGRLIHGSAQTATSGSLRGSAPRTLP